MNSQPSQSTNFLKAKLNLEESTYLNIALTKKLFSRPTNSELFYETDETTSYTLYFDNTYYQKLKSEINQAYITGKFKKTSTEKEWNDMKYAIDKAQVTAAFDIARTKPYLSTLIENTTEQKRTFTFNSTKVSVSEGMLDLSPKKIESEYFFEINLSESKVQIAVTDIAKNTRAIIDNLQNQSIGDGGMVLHNQKYMIILEWTKTNTININRIVFNSKEKEVRISYYN
jgi:hypothetical protein